MPDTRQQEEVEARWPGGTAYGHLPIHAHEPAADSTVAAGERVQRAYAEPGNEADPHREEVRATRIVPADATFSSAVALDLGGGRIDAQKLAGQGEVGAVVVGQLDDFRLAMEIDLGRGGHEGLRAGRQAAGVSSS